MCIAEDYMDHMVKCHKRQDTLRCEVCDLNFSQLFYLERHLKSRRHSKRLVGNTIYFVSYDDLKDRIMEENMQNKMFPPLVVFCISMKCRNGRPYLLLIHMITT